eukprot:TRINITY_DN26720_c0_g1_i1.p1 TRINITY_DN26720_c0_g1~~TRINITY_DN26720_c0_g1_i1.p1  ORF type:complete len:200 (-),score=40.94 TRINITY_DN26720_c0_g1_i1:105-704(-)
MGGDSQDAGFLGWKNWRIPDEWNRVSRDRTEKSPDSGAFLVDSDCNDPTNPQRGAWFPDEQYNPVRHPQRSIAWDLMKVWQPHYKSFFTDMGAYVASSQAGVCAKFEIQALECIEYYGAKQGITACKDWYDDYMECTTGAKQWLRMRAMFKKRHIDNHLEYLQGKRTWDETYEKPPKHNAFLEPWYDESASHLEVPMMV